MQALFIFLAAPGKAALRGQALDSEGAAFIASANPDGRKLITPTVGIKSTWCGKSGASHAIWCAKFQSLGLRTGNQKVAPP